MSYVWTFVHVPSPHLDSNTRLWASLHAERVSFIYFLILNCGKVPRCGIFYFRGLVIALCSIVAKGFEIVP